MEESNYLKAVDCRVGEDCIYWQLGGCCNCVGKLTINEKGICVSYKQNMEFFKRETHRLHGSRTT